MWGFHGDVILVKSSIPQGAVKRSKSNRGYILAEGEVTGHAHVITDECELYEKDGKLYLNAPKNVFVTHEEHNKTEIQKGTYEVRIAKEYDHFREEARRVLD